MDFNSLLNVASDAAQSAGRHALSAINTAKSSIKNNNELVTQLDTQCQNIIIERIQKSFSGHGFVAEEGQNGKLLKINPSSEPLWWVIDPIDGTNNYAHGVFCFSVSIAVISNGLPVVGVVFDPNTNALFTAVSGSPSLCNGKVMQTTSETINEYASVAVDSHFEEKFAPAICGLIQKSRFRNFGTTALHLAYVAKAGLVGMVTSNAKLWDIAAGGLLVQNAGGIITDWNGNDVFPVNMDQYNGRLINTIAANKAVHQALVNMFKS